MRVDNICVYRCVYNNVRHFIDGITQKVSQMHENNGNTA